MKGSFVKYKSFTLIEVILALIISTIIATYIINQKSFSNYLEAVKNTQSSIENIVNNGIIGNTGYASARGGNCSSDYDFSNMDSQRLILCNEWNDDNNETTNDRFKIIDDEIEGYELMGAYGQCSLDIKVVSTNIREFDIFVDCSNVKYNSKTLELLEDSLSFTFENTLSDLFISIEHKATSLKIETHYQGDKNNIIDGMFRVRMGM